ncbi:MAG: VanW family protein [Oscillospiraceae bacterium]|nr:VanW family protein [Oscillospiraceae bacterium]
MKRLLLISIMCLLLLTGCSFNGNNNTAVVENKNANVSNNATDTTNNTSNVAQILVGVHNDYSTSLDNNSTPLQQTTPSQQIDLSSFTTKVLTSDPNRNNNIAITCSKLNEHIIKAGETFSFTGTVGQSTSSEGYEKANVFTADGDTIKGLGGGNCQISSTLYNAVLAVPGLTVVERHAHSQKVYYVPEGKDAAVAYGSVDFKFKNDLDYDIKILATSSPKEVTIKLIRV